jgi:hypothetical protein
MLLAAIFFVLAAFSPRFNVADDELWAAMMAGY